MEVNCGLLLELLHLVDLMHKTTIQMTRHVRTKFSATRPTDTPTTIGTISMSSGVGIVGGKLVMVDLAGVAGVVVALLAVVGLK